nr:immunoglobulin heavy chain junction region [Mus musculus]MBK4185600.1 immunoglobulin heavy chain junction region [Mus musculus]
CARHSNYDFW